MLTVSWTHPSGTVGEYEVYAELNGTLIGDNTTVAGDAQTATIQGLYPGTYYNVFVKSFSFNVEGPAANVTQVPTGDGANFN